MSEESSSPRPPQPVRVVGFKVTNENSPSPTSILTSRSAGQLHSTPSPRSRLTDVLKTETTNPLPRLNLRIKPRPQSGLRKSQSHADLSRSSNLNQSHPETPASAGSRASTSSTPVKIPSAMARVNTCPIDFTDFYTFSSTCNVAATIPSGAVGPGPGPSSPHPHPSSSARHLRSSSEETDVSDGGNGGIIRNLFPGISTSANGVAGSDGNKIAHTDQSRSTTTTTTTMTTLGLSELSLRGDDSTSKPPLGIARPLPIVTANPTPGLPPLPTLHLPRGVAHRRSRSDIGRM